jgi:2-phospho-L-lactate guanylyltransferase
MNYYALIPIKSLILAKTRLSKYLSLEERKQLVLQMLDHVITVLQLNKKIAKIIVVTPDETIKKYLASKKVVLLHEEKSGLNNALTFAAQYIDNIDKETIGLLTILADLPLLTEKAIDELFTLFSREDIVLAASKDGGTNALLMKPFTLPYLFGVNSFEKYRKKAQKRNLRVRVYQNQATAFDIDTIEDVQKLKRIAIAHGSYITITDNKGNIS